MGCVEWAIDFFILRCEIDTSPIIAEMRFLQGMESFLHFYYRSDEYIASRFGSPQTDYTGSIAELPAIIIPNYQLYVLAPHLIDWANTIMKLGHHSFREHLEFLAAKGERYRK